MPHHSPHIVAVITPHGFGHAAIVTAILADLCRRNPLFRITILSTVPEHILRARLAHPFLYIPFASKSDFGMVMRSSVDIAVQESFDRYRYVCADWKDVLNETEIVLCGLNPDVLITSVSYSSIAAAENIGIPAIAIGPFSWVEIFSAFCGHIPGAFEIIMHMMEAYEKADAFLRCEPGVPMTLGNQRDIGPVGTPGRDRRADLPRLTGGGRERRFAFLSMGGIHDPLPFSQWALPEPWYLIAGDENLKTRGYRPADLGLSISDAIASSDAVITKPGYGTYVEAACAGVPLLYRNRPDWPETEGLHNWYAHRLPIFQIDTEIFMQEGPGFYLQKLSDAPRNPLGPPSGNEEAARVIEGILCS